MNTPVQLVYFGEVIEGFQRDDVQRRLGELLKLDETKHAHLFSGERRVLKRSVTRAEAERYVQHLAKLGARLHVEPEAQPQPVATKPAIVPATPVPATATATAAALLPAAPAATTAAPAAPAEEEIVCPNCGERQSKRILCRACATNMPMGIAAKEEAEREAREARRAEWRAKRGLPPEGADEAFASSSGEFATTWGLGFSGRIGRLRYATAGTVLLTVMVLLTRYLIQRPGAGSFVFFALGMLGVVYVSVRLAVLRLHDFNRSGWWSLVMLVPYLGSVASLVVALLPGTQGPNEHGDPPPKGSWKWLVLWTVAFCLAVGFALQAFIAYYNGGEDFSSNPAVQNEHAAAEAMAATMLPSGDAKAAFESHYQPAQNHKVFATSSHGGWGFAVGKPSLEDAFMAAIADCEARRPPYTPQCSPVNVNGQWGRFEER